MPSFFPIQTGFHAGEISGRGRGRLDLPLYKFGLAYCESFEPMAQGSLRMRSGSEHMLPFVGADARIRLTQFRMVSGVDYVVALLDHALRIFSIDGAQVAAAGVENSELVVNGGFTDADGVGWTGRSDAAGGEPGGNVLFRDTNGNPSGYGNIVNRTNGTQSPVLFQRVTVAANANVRMKFKLKCGYGTVNLLYKISTTDPATWPYAGGKFDGGGEKFVYTGMPVARDNVWRDVDFGNVALTPGDYYISFQAVNASGVSLQMDDVSLLATFTGGAILDIPSPWSADEVRDVQLVSETGADRTIFVHPNHPPYFLRRDTPVTWSFGNITFANKPVEWTGTNWPGVIEICDGRAYYSGTPNEKNRWWASRSGSFFDLRTATGPEVNGTPTPLAVDGMDYKLATKGAIRWIQGNRKILVGTDLSEHSITGSKEMPMPGDVYVRRESGFGSCANVQPVDAGDFALYVSGDRRKVRAIAYDFQVSGWKSKDVTFFAEHMTLGKLKELHHVFAPEGCLIGLLEDGTFILATFEPDENVVAWWRLPLASGAVRSAAASRGDDGAFLWAAVERAGAMFLERIPLTDPAARFFLDAAVEATADANGNVAVTHLTGAVRVLSEGALVGDFNAVGGVLALGAEYANADVVVGLPFRAKAVTLPLEGGNPGGTSQGFKVHYTDITARLNNSAPPLLNGARAGKGRPFATPLDTVEELVTADLGVSSMKVEEGGVITIEQDLPFRTEICALYAQAHVSKI